MASVRVGLFPPVDQPGGSKQLQSTLARVAEAGVDHLCVGDHVSFFVGAGSDGLVTATSLLASQAELPVYIGLYLLPLRHPVPVARQLATIAQLAPGRLTLGVGIGGEDRHEIEVCGIDPKTRGRRMNECLQILRGLADGTPLTFQGEFFSLQDALIVPAPSPRIPLIVGGRSDAAVSRAARLGDGWLGIWVSRTPVHGGARSDHPAGQQPPAETRAGSSMRSTSGAASARRARRHADHWPRRCSASTKCHSNRSSATRHTAPPSTSRSSSARTSTPAAQRST